MSESLFTRLMRGELPCHRIYEDALTFAFLDIAPLARGHTLLVPKAPAQSMDALDDASAAAMGRVLPRLCRAVMTASGAPAYNILQNNGRLAHQEVMHVHIHIIPRPHLEAGLGLVWRPGRLAPDDGAALAQQMAAALAAGA